MDLSQVLDPRRWRQRFKSESDVRAETIAAGQAPDATVDEVGPAPAPEGFEGTALHGHRGNGYGLRGGASRPARRVPQAVLVELVARELGDRKSRRWDSNPRPTLYKSVALPAELLRPAGRV
jgi:hypothetical protein